MRIRAVVPTLLTILRYTIVASLLLQLIIPVPMLAVAPQTVEPAQAYEGLTTEQNQSSDLLNLLNTDRPRLNAPQPAPNRSGFLNGGAQEQGADSNPLTQLPAHIFSAASAPQNANDPLASLPVSARPEQLDLPEVERIEPEMVFEVGSSSTLQADSSVSSLSYLPMVLANADGSTIPTAPIVSVSGNIRPEIGGTLVLTDHVTADFTGYELAEDVTVTLTVLPEPDILTEGLGVAGIAFELTAVTAAGGLPVTNFPHEMVTIEGEYGSYPEVDPGINLWVDLADSHFYGVSPFTVSLYRKDEAGEWIWVPSALDLKNKTLTADVGTTAEFVVLGQLATAAPTAAYTVTLDTDNDVAHATWGGVKITELPFSFDLAQRVQAKFAPCSDVHVQLTRSSASDMPTQGTRASIAVTNQSNIFTTLAFNSLIGLPWGYQGDGGVEGWTRASRPVEDETLLYTITGEISSRTTRPDRQYSNSPTTYPAFQTLPASMHYAHIEVLFLDHHFDHPVIETGMDALADAVFAGLLTDLQGMGLSCSGGGGGGGGGGSLYPPAPPAALIAQWRNAGYHNVWQAYGADPVSFSTGNFIHTSSLFSMPSLGGFDVDFDLTYNAQDGRNGSFGYGWSSPYSSFAQKYDDDSVSVRLWDGRTYHYVFNGSGYDAPAGVFATLADTADGWEWTTKEGMVYTFLETEGGLGVLQQLTDRRGNTHILQHDLSVQPVWQLNDPIVYPPLMSIEDGSGRSILFEANGKNYITKITLPDGREFSFDYSQEGDLISMTDPNGGTVDYQYDERHRMTHLTDAEGILYLQNTYDSLNRVTGQVDASGSVNELAYDDGTKTTVYKDNLGVTTTYQRDDLMRVIAIVNALGGVQQFVYDGDYNLTKYTDQRHNTWEYSYDSLGNLQTETDPDLFVTSYSYDAFNDIISMTDQGGPGNSNRTMSYVYDGVGNLTEITHFDMTTTTADYDSFGQMVELVNQNVQTTTYGYDGDGNLITVTDALSQTTTYGYDGMGRQTSIEDANGRIASFEYDGNDNIIRITDPKGWPTSFEYDLNDNLTEMVDRRGGVTRYVYDENLKLIRETSPAGRITTYSYDKMYNRLSMTDPNGNTTLYLYDDLYRLIRVEDALGGATRFSYDQNGNVTQVRDALNQVTTFSYDRLNRVDVTTDPLGGQTDIDYDAVGREVQVTNPRGAVTRYEYDLEGRVIEIIDADTNSYTMNYDDLGNVISMTDPLTRTIGFLYDDVNRLIERADGEGNPTYFGYDGVGNVITMTDALSRTTTYLYDANDNLVLLTDPLEGETSFTYTHEDELETITDANGHTTRFAYDLDGLLVLLLEAGGQITTYLHDKAGNLIELRNARGYSWHYTYDALNRRVSGRDPLNNLTVYEYDILGRMVRLTDANGVSTRYDYDALDRLVRVVQNDRPGFPADVSTNVKTDYVYDPVGNLTKITDANGHVTEFTYDLLDRLETEVNPLLKKWVYQYDAVGNLVLRTDANLAETAYSYDANDLLETITYSGTETISYTYDAVYNLTAVYDGVRDNEFAYDDLNRVISATNEIDGLLLFDYDPVGNRTKLTYPRGISALYAYDANNRLVSMIDPSGDEFTFDYEETHLLSTITYPNGYVATQTYDDADRLISVHNMRDERVLANYDYTLDNVGNRLQLVETLNERLWEDDDGWLQNETVELTHDYAYDRLYRLTEVYDSFPDSNGNLANRHAVYEFDAVGNRLSLSITGLGEDGFGNGENPLVVDDTLITAEYNEANQLERYGDTTYEYDDNGNRIFELSATESISYTYDLENRLIGVERCPVDGSTTCIITENIYDGLGRRVQKLEYEKDRPSWMFKRRYAFEGLDVIREWQWASIYNEDQIFYFYRGVGRILEMECNYGCDENGTPERAFLHHDGLGSVVAFTAPNGQLLTGNRTDEYGRPLNTIFGELTGFSYTGQEYDSSTGLYHFYAREYDPITGTWLQQDWHRGITAQPKSIQRYAYVANNPILYADIEGFILQIVGGAVGGALRGGGLEFAKQAIDKAKTGGISSVWTAEYDWGQIRDESISGAAGGAVLAATGNPILAAAASGGVSSTLEAKRNGDSWSDSLKKGAVGAVVDGGLELVGGKIAVSIVKPRGPKPKMFSKAWWGIDRFAKPKTFLDGFRLGLLRKALPKDAGRPATKIFTKYLGKNALRERARSGIKSIVRMFPGQITKLRGSRLSTFEGLCYQSYESACIRKSGHQLFSGISENIVSTAYENGVWKRK